MHDVLENKPINHLNLVNISDSSDLIFYQLKNSHKELINYCYLIVDEKNRTAVAIDPAWEASKFEVILAKHQITRISVLLTHHHGDHVDLAKFFALKYQSDVYMHHDEILYYGFECPNLIPITTESSFRIANITITPIFTPGHTIGSICYLIDKHLYTGDTLFIEGCGICTGRGGNPVTMFKSLIRLKEKLVSSHRIYPGHKYHAEPGQDFSYVMKSNIYLHLDNEQHFVNFRMRVGQKGIFNFK